MYYFALASYAAALPVLISASLRTAASCGRTPRLLHPSSCVPSRTAPFPTALPCTAPPTVPREASVGSAALGDRRPGLKPPEEAMDGAFGGRRQDRRLTSSEAMEGVSPEHAVFAEPTEAGDSLRGLAESAGLATDEAAAISVRIDGTVPSAMCRSLASMAVGVR